MADDAGIHWALSGPESESGSVVRYRLDSECQARPVRLRIVSHSAHAASRVLIVLPVEPEGEMRFGDPVKEVLDSGLHNRFDFLYVFPDFVRIPWYGDHPSDRTIRHETFVMRALLPAIKARFPATVSISLLGFSKSGCGAFSLLLRHPDIVDAAAAWDAPFMQNSPDRYGMDEVFVTEGNYARYRISDLLERQAGTLGNAMRLGLYGYDVFRDHVDHAHVLMKDLNIPHDYSNGTYRAHNWHSGWVATAVAALADMTAYPSQRNGIRPTI